MLNMTLLMQKRKKERLIMNFKRYALKRMHIRTSMKDSLSYCLLPSVPLKKKTKVPGKDVILKADRRLFRNMVLVVTGRYLDMREILKHPQARYFGHCLILIVLSRKQTNQL